MTLVPDVPAELTHADLLAELISLRGKLTNLAAIEQAKGALMVTYGLSADAAFDLLRYHSQSANVRVSAIASQLASLLASSATDSQAITRFDRLIDTVTESLQRHLDPATQALATAHLHTNPRDDQNQARNHGGADPNPPPERTERLAAPGITIAENIPNLPLIYANTGFTELTGYPLDDILGRNCRFLQGPGTDPKAITTLSYALHTGHDVSVVVRNYRSDGSPFLNKVSISPIRNPLNQITQYIGTQIDVTPTRKPQADTPLDSAADERASRPPGPYEPRAPRPYHPFPPCWTRPKC